MKFWNRITNSIEQQPAEYHANPPYSWAEDIHEQREPSTWVKSIDWVENPQSENTSSNVEGDNGTLTVTRTDGEVRTKDNFSINQLKDFINHPSKGRFINAKGMGQ